MECIRRFCKLLSKQQCNCMDCITTKNGFQKCDESISSSTKIRKTINENDILDRSLHKDISDQEINESEYTNEERLIDPEEPTTSFEMNENIFINDYLVPEKKESFHNITVDDFDDNHYEMEN